MAQGWCTKEDVLKALEEVAPGRRVADVDGFLYGEQAPPPRVYNDEEEEVEARFGRAAAADLGRGDGPGPDLNGITQMLRMVQNYEPSTEEGPCFTANKKIVISKLSSNNKITEPYPKQRASAKRNLPKKTVSAIKANAEPENIEPKNSSASNEIASPKYLSVSAPETKVMALNNGFNLHNLSSAEKAAPPVTQTVTNCAAIVSNLNPNVKEFIPRNAQNIAAIPFENINSTDIDGDSSKEKQKNNKKELALLLKKDISTKSDTFLERRKTDLAIVKLLKLYAEPKQPEEKLKLLTPEYFQKSAGIISNNIETLKEKKDSDRSFERMASLHRVDEASDIIVAADDPSQSDGDLSMASGRPENSDTAMFSNDVAIAETKVTSLNKDNTMYNKKNIATEDELDATQLTPNMDEFCIDADAEDPSVKESISKVNNWLNNKPVVSVCDFKKPASPILSPCAVAFKRKDPVTCKSPSEVTGKKILKPVAEYKPSDYAEELHRKFSERSKAETPPPKLNIWEKLEADLKKKDKEMRSKNA